MQSNKKKIIFIKGDICTKHARVKNFIKYFNDRDYKLKFYCWLRNPESTDRSNLENYILKGGGYNNKYLIFYYPLWFFKVLITLIFERKKNKNAIFFAIDFDTAFPVYLFSLFSSNCEFIYDVHDDFDLRYKFPSIVNKILIFLEEKIRSKSLTTIHVDKNRVRSFDKNYSIIYNSHPDFFKSNNLVVECAKTNVFVFSGLISKSRGAKSIFHFLDENEHIKIILAGNIVDDWGLKLSHHERVEYLGYVDQSTLFDKIKGTAGIFSLYEPDSEINKRAASNKLYDSMMMGIPVITNHGLLVESFVVNNNLGFLVPFSYNKRQWDKLLNINSALYNSIGSNGRNLYLSSYSFKTNYEDKINLILKNV